MQTVRLPRRSGDSDCHLLNSAEGNRFGIPSEQHSVYEKNADSFMSSGVVCDSMESLRRLCVLLQVLDDEDNLCVSGEAATGKIF